MFSPIFSNNKDYISASRASKKIGYASDYIGQLCRAKKIPGQLIGRTWYVDFASLVEHKRNRRFKKKVEKNNTLTQTLKIKNVVLSYSPDELPLLPQLSKKKFPKKKVLSRHFLKEAITVSLSLLLVVSASLFLFEQTASPVVTDVREKIENTLIAVDKQLAAVSALSGVDKFLDSVVIGFRNLKDLALSKIFFATAPLKIVKTALPRPPVSAESPDVVKAVTESVKPLSLASLKSELKTELENYIRIQIDSARPPVTVYSSTPAVNTVVLREEVLLADTRPTVTRQSSSDVNNFSSGLARLADGGTFTNSSLTGATVSGPTGSFSNFTFTNATGTSATTTSFFSTTASSTNLFFTTGYGGHFTSTGLGTFANLLLNASSTLQNFTFVNATGTSATTTNFFSTNTTFSSTDITDLLFTRATGTSATTTNFFSTTASSTNLFSALLSSGSATFTNLLLNGSSTLQNFTFNNATGTSATTTNFFSTTGTFTDLYVNNYQQNNGTFSIISTVATGDIFSVLDNAITSGTLIHQTLTANAGNGQTSKGQIIDLVDSTTAGGGYTALTIGVTGSGVGSGNKYLLDLNPSDTTQAVFDSTGSFRPTVAASSNTNSLGSASFYWKNAYIDTITANNLAGTVTGGNTSSNTWTIGSTETSDSNKALVFQRNSGSGNAIFQWNAGTNDLRYLSVNYPFNNTYTVNDSSIGTTANLYSGLLTNNTTSGTQKLLSLTNTGTGTTENGLYINNTGTASTSIEIAGTWVNVFVSAPGSGNFGIGTTSPYAALSVLGEVVSSKFTATTTGFANRSIFQNFTFNNATGTSATTTNFFSTTASSTNLFSSLLTVGGTGLVVDSARNVGIGTSSPATALDVAGVIQSNGKFQKSGAALTGFIDFQDSAGNVRGRLGMAAGNFDTAGGGYYVNSGASNRSFTASGLDLIAGDLVSWRASAFGSLDSGFSRLSAAKIAVGNGVAGNVTGTLIAGDVGIATSSPYAKLSVVGGTSGTVIAADALSGFSGSLLDLKVASSTKFVVNQNGDVTISGNSTTTSATTTNLFSTTASSTNLYSSLLTVGGSTGLLVDASRNIGLGTTPGSEKVTISGNIGFSNGPKIKDSSGKLELQAGGSGAGNGGTGSIYFLDSAAAVRGRIDTTATTTLNSGNGADGAVTLSGSKNLNTELINSLTYADGVAYKVDTAVSFTSNTVATVDTPSGLTAGNEVLLINLQGASGDVADVGNYEFLTIESISSKTLTFTTSIVNHYTGTTASNQKIVVQRVPNYTNVTLNSGGVLTASAWDGLATTPSGTAGYYTGIVAFRANGTVTVGSNATITVSNLGYRKGAGATGSTDSQKGGNGGESLTGVGGTGHIGTDATGGGGGGGGGGNASSSTGANGTYGGGGGAGFQVASGGTGSSTGGAGGGGGANAGGGGGGYGSGGTGGNEGTAHNSDANAVGGTGGSTSGNGGLNSVTSSPGGGGGGGTYGSANLATLYFGSGGGGGGKYGQTDAVGGDGGNGGGIVFIATNEISVAGAVSANGQNGSDGSSAYFDGGGAGGAGGSILLISASTTLGTSLVTAASSTGGLNGENGGAHNDTNNTDGGKGGAGRVAIKYLGSLSGSTSPSSANIPLSTSNSYGTLYIGTINTISADLAEYYPTHDLNIEAGDAVSVESRNGEWGLVKASGASPPLGIISTNPSLILGGGENDKSSERLVALSGRVPLKVSDENGPIKTGDRLAVSSNDPGIAVKAVSTGDIIAIALESFGEESENITYGTILAFVSRGYWSPTLASIASTTANLIASSTASSSEPLIPEGLFDFIIEKLAEWGITITQVFTRINDLFAGTLHIENQLCVDDICVSKDQLKALLIQIGGTSSTTIPTSITLPEPAPDPVPTSTEPIIIEPTSTTTPEVTDPEPTPPVPSEVEGEPLLEPAPELEPEPDTPDAPAEPEVGTPTESVEVEPTPEPLPDP
ncbi:MAG: hypothetical protein Q8Q92_00650 [bacterium]|nr:hypothetical protein [bacterium]